MKICPTRIARAISTREALCVQTPNFEILRIDRIRMGADSRDRLMVLHSMEHDASRHCTFYRYFCFLSACFPSLKYSSSSIFRWPAPASPFGLLYLWFWNKGKSKCSQWRWAWLDLHLRWSSKLKMILWMAFRAKGTLLSSWDNR